MSKLLTLRNFLVGFLIAIGLSLIAGAIVNVIMLIPSPFKVANNNDWIGFYGGFFGAALGSLTTLLGLWITLEYYRKRDDMEENDNEEKKRLSIMPYFKVTNLNEFTSTDYHSVRFYCHENNHMLDILRCKFLIENVGLGTGVDITFPSLYSFDKTVDTPNLTMVVRDREYIELIVDFPTGGYSGNVIWLTICYKDLLGNSYEQPISIQIYYERQYMAVDGTLYPKLII